MKHKQQNFSYKTKVFKVLNDFALKGCILMLRFQKQRMSLNLLLWSFL